MPRRILYSDAGLHDNGDVGIGIYDPNTNSGAYVYLPKTNLTINQAELLGTQYAHKIGKLLYPNCSIVVMTDNEGVAQKSNRQCSWIPRELNKEADSLATKATNLKASSIPNNLLNHSNMSKKKAVTYANLPQHVDLNGNIKDINIYLRKSFPLNQRLALAYKLAKSNRERELLDCMIHNRAYTKDYKKLNKEFLHFLKGAFDKKEVPDCVYKDVFNRELFKVLSDKAIIKLLKEI